MRKKIYMACMMALIAGYTWADEVEIEPIQDEDPALISEVLTTKNNVVLGGGDLVAPRNVLNYDPYEKYNRWMFNVNDTLDTNIVTPVARGYRKVVPRPIRTGARNFFNNLRDVVSFGSNVLRLDVKRASEDLVRVGLNTTFGLGGLIDIAGAAQIPNNKNSLGDTFASWGWKNSHYFVMPLLGPSTVRDGLGTTIVVAFPIDKMFIHDRGYRYTMPILLGIDTRESVLDLTDSLEMAAMDKYAYVRDGYMSIRVKKIGLDIPTEADLDIDELVNMDSGSENVQDNNSDNGDNAAAVEDSSALDGNASDVTVVEPIVVSETVKPVESLYQTDSVSIDVVALNQTSHIWSVPVH